MTYREPLQDPQNPNVSDYAPETPDLSTVLEELLRQRDVALRVCLPASVVAVTAVQQVDVQPTLQGRYLTQSDPTTLPVIKNVPVSMSVGQTYQLKLPISVGDPGMLIFCDRSLDVWSQSDGKQPVDPADSRTHDISDPVFVPGLAPFGHQLTDASPDLVVACGKSSLRVQPAGTFKLQAQGGDELLNLLNTILQNQIDLIGQLAGNTYTNTLMGPQPFLATSVAQLSKLKQTAQDLLSRLGKMTGS